MPATTRTPVNPQQPEMKPGLRLGVVAPRAAIEFFASKNKLLPSFSWQDVWQQEHAAGVAVAGVMRADVQQLFADEIGRTITAGGDLRAFKKRLIPALEKAGFWGGVEIQDPVTGDKRITRFDKRRLELIFDVNLRQAHAAGQWERIQAGKSILPFLRYSTAKDERVRASHKAWHGLVLPVDDAFWRTHYPPNGWRCRCHVTPMSERDIARYAKAGEAINRTAPPLQEIDFVNKRTGEISRVPRGIDPGFAYNPGMARLRGVLPHELPDLPGGGGGGGGGGVSQVSSLAPTARLPLARTVPTSDLLATGLTDADYINSFMAEAGGTANAPTEFTDVSGHVLVLDKEMFWSSKSKTFSLKKGGREAYTRLLARTITEPDEIWVATEPRGSQGETITRRRYISRFDIAGQSTPLISVFESSRDGWRSVATFASTGTVGDVAALQPYRVGALIYTRP